MSEVLRCFRCGESLERLSLPLSRRDACPACHVHLHVCRMCRYFDAHVPRMCREDDAEDVSDKEKVNFCDWFKPSADAFDEARAGEAAKARSELDALFGGEPAGDADGDEPSRQAEDLFK